MQPDTLLVPPELEKTAFEIVRTMNVPDTTDYKANFVAGFMRQVIVWDYLTDANAWFLIDSHAHEAVAQVDRPRAAGVRARPDLQLPSGKPLARLHALQLRLQGLALDLREQPGIRRQPEGGLNMAQSNLSGPLNVTAIWSWAAPLRSRAGSPSAAAPSPRIRV